MHIEQPVYPQMIKPASSEVEFERKTEHLLGYGQSRVWRGRLRNKYDIAMKEFVVYEGVRRVSYESPLVHEVFLTERGRC